MSDRMDRGEIDNIESHRGKIGKPRFAIPQSSMTSRLGRTGSRKDFVPRGETCLLAVNCDAQLFLVAAGNIAIGVALHQAEQLSVWSNYGRGCLSFALPKS